MYLRVLLVVVAVAGLCGCGDLPEPFLGNPGATARRLAQPTAALLAVAPPTDIDLPDDASRELAAGLAASLRRNEVPAQAKAPQKHDWQLVSRARQRDQALVPVFMVKDPAGKDMGSTDGAPVPLTAWAVASPDLMRQVADDAAPKIAALLTSIRIARDRADPNNLYNRPAKVMVADVAGAPGDGDQALTRQLRLHLAAFGPLIQTTEAGADFLVHGQVVLVPTANDTQRVEIQWTVSGPGGDERGKVVQLHEIPAGSLDHYWGDVAVAAATEAAGGINEVILRQSGREDAASKAPEAPAAAAAELRTAAPAGTASGKGHGADEH